MRYNLRCAGLGNRWSRSGLKQDHGNGREAACEGGFKGGIHVDGNQLHVVKSRVSEVLGFPYWEVDGRGHHSSAETGEWGPALGGSYDV